MAIVIGTGMDEDLFGTEDDDTIFGWGGADFIFGLGGNDIIDGGDGDDSMDGGGGVDTASYAAALAGVSVNLLLQGSAQNTLGAGVDTLLNFENLIGSAFNDSLIGDGGSNVLYGGDGDDYVDGFSGDDFLDAGAGNDWIDGSTGVDWVSYASATAGVSVNFLLQHSWQDTAGAGVDYVGNFENLEGSEFDDTLIGDANANQINGLGGNDFIDGGGGDDIIHGGASTGTFANGDFQALFGGEGVDTIFGGDGEDLINLQPTGNANTGVGESAFGGGGDDLIRNTSGGDLLDGGDGVDRVSYFNIGAAITLDLMLQGAAQNTGGGGFDTLVSIENISGTAFNDTIRGDDNANQINANAGDDIVEGRGGDDVLIGDGDAIGNDVLDGGSGVDTVSYNPNLFESARTEGVFVNLLAGFGGSISGGETDTLVSIENVEGTDFDDQIIGDNGDNALSGLGGNDVIQGRGGNDAINGGDGDDNLQGDGNFAYNGPSGNDTISGGAGNDLMRGGQGVDSFDGGDGDDDRVSFYTLYATQAVVASALTQTIGNDGFGNAETMTGVEGLGAGTRFADWFEGSDAANTLVGDTGDTVLALGGDDNIFIGAAPGLIDGGAGVDTLDLSLGSTLVDTNGDGVAEVLNATAGFFVDLASGQIIDDGFGNSGAVVNVENVTGSLFDDTLVGDGNANVLDGGEGNDTLYGGLGRDRLFGGNGDDLLVVGANSVIAEANEVYNGGAGFDTLQIDTGVLSPGQFYQTGFYGAGTQVASIERILFNETAPGTNMALFLTFQLGGGIANNATFVGSENKEDIVFLAVTPGIHSLAGTSFTLQNWTTNPGEYWRSDAIQLFAALPGLNYTLIGSAGNDVIQGNNMADVLQGGDGDDSLVGRGGADNFSGGNGDDIVLIGSSDPAYTDNYGLMIFDGGAGTDFLLTIGQTVDLRGSGVVLTGFEGIGLFHTLTLSTAGPPPVSLPPLVGSQVVIDQAILAQLPTALQIRGSGYFLTSAGELLTQEDNIEIVMSPGDVINMSAWTFALWDETQDRVAVFGSAADDTIIGSIMADDLSGAGGADVIQGRGGNDTLRGGEGDDHLAGESISSSYNGPFGNDALFGEGGDDLLRGGAGVDSFDGGVGQDRVSFFTRAATQGAIANLATQTISNDGFGNAETMVSIENLGAGTAFADHLTGDDNDNFLLGEMGDTLLGAGGNDSFQLGGGPALLDGGAGIDTITGFFGDFGSLVPDSNGDGLAEVVFATSGVTVNLLTGQILNDGFGLSGTLVGIENVNGSALADTLTGDNGDNILGGLDGNDVIDGGKGNDQIAGDAGDDVLAGGKGVDRLSGGAGNDTLDGGAQDDTFLFAPGGGLDTVRDFDANPGGGGQDMLDISAYGITAGDFAARVAIADLGAHMQVTIDGADVITLLGVNGNGQNIITVNDFILAS